MFAEGRRLYSDKICLLEGSGFYSIEFRQCMFAESRRLNSDNVCLLKLEGCI